MAKKASAKAATKKAPARRVVQARFDVAQTTADNRKHWTHADGLSARAAMSPAVRRVIRLRSRYEAENNSWYAGILRTAVNHIVGGTGPRLQVLTADVNINRRIEMAFAKWATQVDFVDMLRIAVESYWRDGECYMMRAEKPRQSPVALDVRLFEADQVSSPWDSSAWKNDFEDDGIRFDRSTNEQLIYVYDHHPGGNVWASTMSGQWYPAKSVVAHLFRAERPGQVHGIPRATPALQTLPIMRRQELATLYSAETAANFAMYLKTNGVTPAAMPEGSDFSEIEITRNMLTTLPEGWEIGQVDPKQPGPQYEMFQRQALMSFCRCTNMPYTLAAGTGKDANFSSFKGDMRNVWEPEVKVEQNRIEVMLLAPVVRWFLESAVFAPGLLAGAPAIQDIAYSWQWAPLPQLDVIESAQAAEMMVSSGQISMSALYMKNGSDWMTESARAAADFGVTPEVYRAAVFQKLFGVTGAVAMPTVANSQQVQGEYTTLKQRDFRNVQKRITQALQQLASGEISQVMAEQTLASNGLAAERIAALIQDALDGRVDDPQMQEAQA